MTCKIERLADAGVVVLRVSGHIQSEHVSTLEELIAREGGRVELTSPKLRSPTATR